MTSIWLSYGTRQEVMIYNFTFIPIKSYSGNDGCAESEIARPDLNICCLVCNLLRLDSCNGVANYIPNETITGYV